MERIGYAMFATGLITFLVLLGYVIYNIFDIIGIVMYIAFLLVLIGGALMDINGYRW